ncbi:MULTISPECIES: bifunctional adenosylcobinamide kinase/adenosylcobinamide-phosphate guanylyltransferase [unclassified Methylophaga]|jgi:adenosylcobinamide kinase/adenosylcobinamide-phosphate guanylyltransferase|uniref:bifunctional adenosylcobinamide kinase/adenosylcobinamide-phosphate guanylyltransferase n=1 Tax=unclassified Methylophaga TaxID=2629249 RepID=UPI0025E0776F|nr:MULTISPECIES: bifunctional adenosylcobinamide kinase/adenosylcobinamide-phosphate guanylyltransferase [unclassified Methylophaga]|tara:strand:- start:1758 stop:2276 length:519 start_codon:yes stop_codon:yes gene_type:complete
MAKTLILGGVKSGKSRLAEQRAIKSKLAVCYVATARADDSEMQQRIALHQQQRPAHWTTIEVPLNLAAALQQQDNTDKCILVDCLTLWLTNLLLSDDENLLTNEIQRLLETLPTLQADIILVSNETSMGIVPMGELTRRFCDEAGRLHQQLAALMDNVILTVAGLPHALKGN